MTTLKTINIKGKEYVTVNERLKYFRESHPAYGLLSEIVNMSTDSITIKASIVDEEGRTIAIGHASEDKTASMINKTSYVENCETSAWGRCLACFGIGIDANVASADELNNALERQHVLQENSGKNEQSKQNSPKQNNQADMPEAERVDGNKKVESAHLTWMKSQIEKLGKEETAFLTYMDIDKLEDMTLDEFVGKAKPALDKKVK